MLFEQIRRDSRVEGLSVRALAKRHRVHRRTVRQALASAMPPEPARRRWQSRKIDPFVDAIDAMLRSDLTAPRKQRHTAVRVLDRLIDEHQATGLSYSTLRGYVAERRREIWAEAGRSVAEVFVPQTHQPAAETLCRIPHRPSAPGSWVCGTLTSTVTKPSSVRRRATYRDTVDSDTTA